MNIPSNFTLEEALKLVPVHPELETRIWTLIEENTEYQEIIESMEAQMDDLKREVSTLECEIEELGCNLYSKEALISELEEEIRELKDAIQT